MNTTADKIKVNKTYERDSGIELLKIFAILVIVIAHTCFSLKSPSKYLPTDDYVVNLATATTDINRLILAFFVNFVNTSNNIFFICSAWFLLDSKKARKQKWFFILIEVWFVSVIIFICTYIARKGNIPFKIIIKSLMPTTFASNWYITCYLLFYPVHVFLNLIVKKLNKYQLLRLAGAMFILYCGINFVKGTLFFCSNLVLWITFYFVIAYMKLYMSEFANSKKANIIMLIICVACYAGIILVINFLGLRISFFQNKLFYFRLNCNPFMLMIAIALFNIMRRLTFKSKVINYISSLSLLIYIIHENINLRNFLRPSIWNYIHKTFGYSHLALKAFCFGILVFISTLICAALYDISLRKLVKKLSGILYSLLRKIYLSIEKKLLMIK